jgi:hypothetical protein
MLPQPPASFNCRHWKILIVVRQNADVAEKVYTGTLDIAQAIIVPAPPPVK